MVKGQSHRNTIHESDIMKIVMKLYYSKDVKVQHTAKRDFNIIVEPSGGKLEIWKTGAFITLQIVSLSFSIADESQNVSQKLQLSSYCFSYVSMMVLKCYFPCISTMMLQPFSPCDDAAIFSDPAYFHLILIHKLRERKVKTLTRN